MGFDFAGTYTKIIPHERIETHSVNVRHRSNLADDLTQFISASLLIMSPRILSNSSGMAGRPFSTISSGMLKPNTGLSRFHLESWL